MATANARVGRLVACAGGSRITGKNIQSINDERFRATGEKIKCKISIMTYYLISRGKCHNLSKKKIVIYFETQVIIIILEKSQYFENKFIILWQNGTYNVHVLDVEDLLKLLFILLKKNLQALVPFKAVGSHLGAIQRGSV